ncbi:ribonuclease HIII [Haloimpatiens massiliensis]|uniref:ribonuclease HIII n=1 Tax=Haloimpatiens massiliensis TaxID=1658110 RepID=UPI000C82670B|nr:ribonuclease HIII [Haloimpatiens massiliensis]
MEWLSNIKDKFQCYEYMKDKFISRGWTVEQYKEINYGLQFGVSINGQRENVRVYHSKKKGITCDFSGVKSKENEQLIRETLMGYNEESIEDDKDTKNNEHIKKNNEMSINEIKKGIKPLIGTDESGKGDFFGPLVIAGVYADENTQRILRTLGVDDSKKLTDKKISSIAEQIKKLCIYSVVMVGNKKYNTIYDKIGNLNKLLAWGHARVIENVLEKVECENVLSDQFGNPNLIKNALMEKGKKVNLQQRPRAEENVVVAAASILARDAFVKNMEQMSKNYGIEFIKGASNMTIEVGKDFAQKFGKGRLNEVAKIHFSTFKKI